MGHRGSYEFSREVKDFVHKRDAGKYPPGTKVEIDHICSIRQAKELGIPAWIISSAINAQLLSQKENRKKADKDADPEFVEYLMSLIVRLL